MKSMRDMAVFVAAADGGSLSAASRRLDISPAVASMAIKRLEDELGVPLLIRTTRSLRLTREGQVFLEPIRQAMQLLADARQDAEVGRAVLRGPLQLSAPSDLGRNAVLSWLDEFQHQHPQVELRLFLSDRLADIFRQPIDLALRYGGLTDSSLVALPIAPHNRRVLCASPAYLKSTGTPNTPQALSEHNCLCFRVGESPHDVWHFQKGDASCSVQVHGNRSADDGEAVRRWALAGHGIAYKSALDVADDLRTKRLVRLCPDWQGELSPLSLVCAQRRSISPLVQSLRRFLEQRCSEALAGEV